MYGDTPEDTLRSHQIFLSVFLLLAALLVVFAVRGFGRGLDVDRNGVVVRNMIRATSIPWRELAAIEFKGVHSEAMSDMYYQLVFQRQDGSRVTADAPGGGATPGQHLFELRERLLAMQSAAQAGRSSIRPQTPSAQCLAEGSLLLSGQAGDSEAVGGTRGSDSAGNVAAATRAARPCTAGPGSFDVIPRRTAVLLEQQQGFGHRSLATRSNTCPGSRRAMSVSRGRSPSHLAWLAVLTEPDDAVANMAVIEACHEAAGLPRRQPRY
jgi:hypothetical protein